MLSPNFQGPRLRRRNARKEDGPQSGGSCVICEASADNLRVKRDQEAHRPCRTTMIRAQFVRHGSLGSYIVLNVRCFSTVGRLQEKPLPPRPKIIETEIEESFLKGSGPGGQKINKTSSAVQIKHLPTRIVVKSQETRSRQQNRKLARQILAEKLDQLEKGEQSRTAIKAERERKKKSSANKKTRRKYRKLEEEKGSGVEVGSEGGEDAGSNGTCHDECVNDAHGKPVSRSTAEELSR